MMLGFSMLFDTLSTFWIWSCVLIGTMLINHGFRTLYYEPYPVSFHWRFSTVWLFFVRLLTLLERWHHDNPFQIYACAKRGLETRDYFYWSREFSGVWLRSCRVWAIGSDGSVYREGGLPKVTILSDEHLFMELMLKSNLEWRRPAFSSWDTT